MSVKKNSPQVPPGHDLHEAGVHHLLNPRSLHHHLPLVSDLPHLLQCHQLVPPRLLQLVTAHQLAVKGSLQLQHLLKEVPLTRHLPLGFLLLQPEEWLQLFL